MPLFEYRCKCGLKFEAITAGETIKMCPRCGEPANRLFPLVNHTFGWRLSDESLNVKYHPDELVRNI